MSDDFKHWLTHYVDKLDEDGSDDFDLTAFLRASPTNDIPSSERLRQLAVMLENVVAGRSLSRAWYTLDRVYQAAIKLAPKSSRIYESRALAACEVAEGALPGEQERAKNVLRLASQFALQAASLAPDDAHIARTNGYVAYMSSAEQTEEALQHFERALALNPSDAWANLYRAHCLQDLGRWAEAVEAYEVVPNAAFIGPTSWRISLLVEQRGLCRLRAGDRAGALRDFETILGRYETQPHLAEHSWLCYLDKAVPSQFPNLEPRLLALKKKLGIADDAAEEQ